MLSVVLSSARSYLFANDANVSYFSPDKVKAFEGLFFVGKKKRPADSFFYKKPHEETCNEWISSSN
jgi:hypothetical protein